jgi:hypothetical protein
MLWYTFMRGVALDAKAKSIVLGGKISKEPNGSLESTFSFIEKKLIGKLAHVLLPSVVEAVLRIRRNQLLRKGCYGKR